MKVLGISLMLLFVSACPPRNERQSLPRLDIYAGYVNGIDDAGYRHAVAAFCNEMVRQSEFFSAAEVRVIRYGDRNSVQAAPVLKLTMPSAPDCRRKGGIFRHGQSERERRCQEQRTQFDIEFNEQVQRVRQVLEVAPQSEECVSYMNLLTRMRFEPNRPISVIITDASHACKEDNGELEPLIASNVPVVVILIATGFDFAGNSEFIGRILKPVQIVPGTSAEQAVMTLQNATRQVAHR